MLKTEVLGVSFLKVHLNHSKKFQLLYLLYNYIIYNLLYHLQSNFWYSTEYYSLNASSKLHAEKACLFLLYFPYRCVKWILFIISPSKHN